MTRLLSALLAALLFTSPVYAASGTITVKDAGGTNRTFDLQTYNAGANFAANAVICDVTTENQCASVSAGGALTVIGNGTFVTQSTVTQATGTNLHAVLDTTSTTAVTQATSSNLKGQVDPLTIATWGLAATTQNVAAPTNGMVMMGQFTTTPTTINTTNVSPLQLDNAGNLLVNSKSGASAAVTLQSAATSSVNGSNLTVTNYSGAVIDVVCSVACSGGTTINFEVADSTGVFVAVAGTPVAGGIPVTTATTTGRFTFTVGGMTSLRARISGYSAGTITAVGQAISAFAAVPSVNAAVPSGANVTEGTTGDTAYAGSGNATVISALKGIYTTASLGTGSFAATTPGSGIAIGCDAVNAEPTAVTNGQMASLDCGLEGKLINLPYANKENMVRGSTGAVTNTAQTSIIASAGGSLKNYITGIQCSNSGASTSILTFTDAAATILINPAGGGTNVVFPVPLATAAATAFQVTPGTSSTSQYCSAQGYKGL